MRNPPTRAAVIFTLLFELVIGFSVSNDSLAQKRPSPLVCKTSVLHALKPVPELHYPCDSQLNGWEEKILKRPERVAAIKNLTSQLSSFSDDAWWAADIVDLSVCDFTHAPGVLTRDQRRAFVSGDYLFWLLGNDHVRLVLIPDPCYQTEYGGSNAFILYRKDGRVFVTQVLDGYFSRADNSVGIGFAKLRDREIIEISTGSGGLNPTLTNYYFVIDPSSSHAIPKKLFWGEHGPTNEISSAMLFGDFSAPLRIVRGRALARSFTIYIDDANGKTEDNGRTFSRKTLRWNGRIYR